MTARNVLVLEDEPIVAFALEDMLFELGFEEVHLATTLAEARDRIDGAIPDVAILDVNVRGERSYPIARVLLALDVPILFATGYGDAEHPAELSQIPTLTKPYSLDQLQTVLRALGRSTD